MFALRFLPNAFLSIIPGEIQHISKRQQMDIIPRIVLEAEKNIIAKMVTMIFGMPRPETEAITVFPGRGERSRLQYAIKVWQAHHRANFFLVAGTEWRTKISTPQPTMELLKGESYGLTRGGGVNIQYHAHSTLDQTSWVVERVRDLGIKSISLVVTPYHLPRAYLTLLKEFSKRNVPWIPVIPLPVPTWPDSIVPEDNTDAWTLFDGEAERILRYQEKGDVATLPELKEYTRWLKNQPLF